MGLEVLSDNPDDWRKVMHDLAISHEDVRRRLETRERVCLFRDEVEDVLRMLIIRIFQEPKVQEIVELLIPAIGGSSFLKKVANDLARPLYARAAMRRVEVGDDAQKPVAQVAWDDISREIELDARMDDIARLLVATNAVFVFPRYVADLDRLCIDVMTGDQLTVKTHPSVPLWPLAIAYDRPCKATKGAIERVVWDDKRSFVIDGTSGLFVEDPVEHSLGLLPIVDIHMRGRTCSYWDGTTGRDLVRQTKNSLLFDLIVAKKIKQQSHIQMAATGQLDGLIKDQVLDELSVITADGNVQIQTLDLQSDPSKIIAAREANERRVEANYGLGDDDDVDAVGRNERVAELATILVGGEARLFSVIKAIAQQAPRYAGRIPKEARLMVDLGQIHNRVNRKTQLEIRQTERSMGLRSGVDDVLEDNPEFKGDRDEAMEYIDERMQEESVIVLRRRALNIPDVLPRDLQIPNSNLAAIGQNPQQNGALGPLVRDSFISKDLAAAAALGNSTATAVAAQQAATALVDRGSY
jgi:hypothetical protein